VQEITPIKWADGKLLILDQTKLPNEEIVLTLTCYEQVIESIKSLSVRGAPAIGVAAGYGMALAAESITAEDQEFLQNLEQAAQELIQARPTAVNLSWAVNRMMGIARSAKETSEISKLILFEAIKIHENDEKINKAMGAVGKEVLANRTSVLTHCNTGALATSGYGTAFGVIRAGIEDGMDFAIYNTETRPFYQGSRLTAWEFQKLGVQSTLVVDSAAGSLMYQGKIDCVLTGADRIASNGDTANKIGTYSLAVLAKENGIPFYIVAPTSTIDMELSSGDEINIEYRDQKEITHFQETQISPLGVQALNPSFDVTPSKYISGIITENQICYPPYVDSIKQAVGGKIQQ
jgi:methylthioribose-1-phosphate isomerase